jgi:lipoprotein-anchoring transpeptidase ErfK/SrfK
MTYKPLLSCAAALVITSFAFGGIPKADARTIQRDDRFVPNHAPGTPLLAVVGLAEQRISIYDAKGKIMESPVSSGQTGYETPAGIYSIVQKEEDHHSNLYDDASMPFMERITWTGMALHAGVLPGYAASHGCVRLPHDFAERLYDVTNMGMRVVVVRDEITPVEVPQPFMFRSAMQKGPEVDRSLHEGISPTRYSPSEDGLSQLRMTLAQKSAEAQNAARKVKDLRLGASKSNTEAASAARSLQAVESSFAKAEADVKAAEQALEQAAPDRVAQLAEAKAQALSKLNAAQAQLDAAKAQAQSKTDAAAQAQADVKAADAALSVALDASEEARLNLTPVSVFISRKTMRVYVRKANHPVYETPLMMRDPGKPIGSFVFTALEAGPSGAMKWNVVSMYKDATNIEPFSKEKQSSARGRRDTAPADVAGAEAALSRLTIPDDALDYISQVVLSGSSLIISDEGPSIETGKDTDFVVFMSGEPQGGIAVRAHHHEMAKRDRGWSEGDWWGSSWSNGEQSRSRPRRGSGGGGWGGFPF